MRVFISYPREFEVAAVALEAELTSRNIKTFLDKEDIPPGEKWRLLIESSIAKANVFVVLYMPEADIAGRVFRAEARRIQEVCKENEQKKLIPVIFPPATVEQVTPHFRVRQVVLANVAGNAKNGHEEWIDQVVQQIVKIKIGKRHQWWRRIATAVSFVAIVGIVLLTINVKKFGETIIGRDEQIDNLVAELAEQRKQLIEKDEQISLLRQLKDGRAVCNRLIGRYALDHKYTFVDGPNARSVARDGLWVAKKCEFSKEDDEWILEGDETTDFDVEVNVRRKGKWARIATATYQYSSKVRISADGTLGGRTFTAVLIPTEVKWVDKDENGESFNLTMEEMKATFNKITTLRNERHKEMKTAPCETALRKKNGVLTVLFTCGNYTRVMVKI